MTDRSPLDGPPVDGLERAFQVPASVREDPTLLSLHSDIVNRLRMEASGLPMNTVQQLLLERIATHYVLMRLAEDSGATTPTMRKDANTLWLSMTQEFNRLLTQGADKLREALLAEIQKVINDSLKHISDAEDRRTVRRSLSEGFADMNI